MQQCQRNSQFYTNILHWSQIQYIIWSNTNKKFTKSYNTIHDSRFKICDSTPTSYIELKFNIFLDPKQIKKFATAPMWFVFFDSTYQLSTLNQIQYIVPIEIRNLLSVPTQFTIHDSLFHTNILQIQYIFGYNTNNTLYNCANGICNSTPTSYKFNIFLDPT